MSTTDHSEKPSALPTPAMSTTGTLHSSDADLTSSAQRAASLKDKEASAGAQDQGHVHPLALLGPARKNFLLFIFSIAGFVDICNVSGVAVAVSQISRDIDLGFSQVVWVSSPVSEGRHALTFADHHCLLPHLCRLPPLRRTSQ